MQVRPAAGDSPSRPATPGAAMVLVADDASSGPAWRRREEPVLARRGRRRGEPPASHGFATASSIAGFASRRGLRADPAGAVRDPAGEDGDVARTELEPLPGDLEGKPTADDERDLLLRMGVDREDPAGLVDITNNRLSLAVDDLSGDPRASGFGRDLGPVEPPDRGHGRGLRPGGAHRMNQPARRARARTKRIGLAGPMPQAAQTSAASTTRTASTTK